jgi:hypothetical protein
MRSGSRSVERRRELAIIAWQYVVGDHR